MEDREGAEDTPEPDAELPWDRSWRKRCLEACRLAKRCGARTTWTEERAERGPQEEGAPLELQEREWLLEQGRQLQERPLEGRQRAERSVEQALAKRSVPGARVRKRRDEKRCTET